MRRHPDFAKESQYSGGSPYQRPQLYRKFLKNLTSIVYFNENILFSQIANWQNNSGPGHFNRGQYPQGAPQQWTNQRPPNAALCPPGQNAQWMEQHRYPPQAGQSPYPSQPGQPPVQWPNMPSQMVPPSNQIRPNQRPPMMNKNMVMPPPQPGKPGNVAPFPSSAPVKRDIVFPPDSIEAVTPLLYRRKRLTKTDIGQTDMWRIFMCLQSGLLSESTWALDVLNILLFDDSAVQYFGLAHLPGLLNLILEHFQKSLSDMFDIGRSAREKAQKNRATFPALPPPSKTNGKAANEEIENDKNGEEEDGLLKTKEYAVDLGQVIKLPNPKDRLQVLMSLTNYTMCSRKGIPVKIKEADDDIFVLNDPRDWDIEADTDYRLNDNVNADPWTYDEREALQHAHLISPFKGEFVNIPFAKYIKSSDRKRKAPTTITDADKNNNGKKDEVNDIENAKKIASAISAVKEEPKDDKIKNNDENKHLSDSEAQKDMDADCSEVDMELEKIPNGPQSNETINSEKNSKTIDDLKLDSFDVRTTIRDPADTLKRRRIGEYEDECYARDEASLYLISENQDTIARRCLCISNILRNLTFVPGNEVVFSNCEQFLAVLGKILLLHHKHPLRMQSIRNYDREDDTDFSDSCSSLQAEAEWWWDYLVLLRENMMVALANIAGHLQLSKYDESITRPCLDGLLHWAICPSAHGQDPFPTCGPHSALSPQRLALEALCKICVTDANVDLVIATPPFSRLENLCSVLTRHLCRNEDQVLREFSVNLLHYLAAADSAMARTVAMQSPCISYLVAFIEQAEQTALGVANQHGINYLRENPDSMGTSLDMLRRTAGTLLHLARHPDNRPLFLQQEQRLLGLVMSHILDQQVALIISRVLFQISRGAGPVTLSEALPPKQIVGKRPLTLLVASLPSSSTQTVKNLTTIPTTIPTTTITTTQSSSQSVAQSKESSVQVS